MKIRLEKILKKRKNQKTIFNMAVYKITNQITNMSYIGQTIQKDPFKRIKRHFNTATHNKSYIQNAIKKYGKENFTIEILHHSRDINELNILEKFYIENLLTLSPHGYNLKRGGEQGGACSDETRKKISEAKFGKPNVKLQGRPFSEEHKKALSIVRKGFTSDARKLARLKNAELRKIPIIASNLKTTEIKYFASIDECAQQLNLTASCISRVLRKNQNRSQHKDWTFEYQRKNI